MKAKTESKSTFARLVGVGPSAVTKYLKLGLPSENGRIPVKAGRAWVQRHMSSALSENPETRKRSRGRPANKDENGFLKARAKLQKIKAETAAHDLARARGAFLPAREVAEHQETRAAAERDALLGLPARVCGELAAKLGVDERILRVELDRLIRLHLSQRSGALEQHAG